MGLSAEKYVGNMQWLKIKLKPFLCWNGLWLLLFFVCMGIYFIGMPKYIDDYWFMHFYRPWFESQGITYPENGGNIFTAGFPWRETIESWHAHFDGDNVRLGNLIVTPLLLFPKWVGSSIALLCLIYVVMAGFRIAEVDWRKSGVVPLALFMWTFLIPWREKFGSMVFQFNYVVVSALALWLIVKIQDGRKGLSTLIGVFFIGLATGWGHEGIGVPVLCGLCALIILFRDCRNSRIITAVAGLIVGLCVAALSPGMRKRANGGIGMHYDFLLTFDYIFTAAPFLILLLVLGVCVFRKRVKAVNKVLIFGIVSGIVSLGISWLSLTRYRGGWWSGVISIICIVSLVQSNSGYFCKKETWKSAVIGGLCVVITFAHLIAVDYYSLLYRKNMRDAFSSYEPGRAYNSLFGDVVQLKDLPLIAGYKCAYYNVQGMRCLPHYFYDEGRDYGEPRMIIPEQLRHVTSVTGKVVPGGDIREYMGYYFTPEFEFNVLDMGMCVDFGKGYVYAPFYIEKFVSEADGKVYCYLEPRFDWYVSHFKTIKRLKRKDEQN